MASSSSAVWYVLGAGSLGCLWASRLRLANIPTRFLLRDETRLRTYQSLGSCITFESEQQIQQLCICAETVKDAAPIERLVLACKAYDAEAAIAALLPRLQPNALILLLQNGMGSQQQIHQRWPQLNVIYVSSTEGAFMRAPFSAVWAGQGMNWLGAPHGISAPHWLSELQQAQIPCSWSERIEDKLWLKLAINCAINPLTVLLNSCNGDLKKHAARVNPLCDELQQLLRHVAPDITSNLHALVWGVIETTSNNRSSMWQDVHYQRRTEIQFLSEFAVKQAEKVGLPVPQLDSTHQQLQQFLRDRGLPSY